VTPRKTTTPPNPTTRTFKRRVRFGGGIMYEHRRATLDGVVTMQEHARFGDEVELTAQQVMTYESVGALAPEGSSRQDVEDAFAQQVEEYRQPRRSVGSVV
jgi:hypothetical protein